MADLYPSAIDAITLFADALYAFAMKRRDLSACVAISTWLFGDDLPKVLKILHKLNRCLSRSFPANESLTAQARLRKKVQQRFLSIWFLKLQAPARPVSILASQSLELRCTVRRSTVKSTNSSSEHADSTASATYLVSLIRRLVVVYDCLLKIGKKLHLALGS